MEAATCQQRLSGRRRTGKQTPPLRARSLTLHPAVEGWVSLKLARSGRTAAAVLPRMARYQGALQADGHRRGLGHHQPFFTMVVFSLFFGNLAGSPPTASCTPSSATLPSSLDLLRERAEPVVQQSGGQRQHRSRKIYFPAVIPLSSVLSGVIDFALAFLVLLGMMLFYGIVPTLNVIWLPPLLLLALVTALGVGLWLSAMNVQFRDVRYAVPFLVQFWMFATPIAYPSSLIENDLLRTLYGLNPMVGVVEGFRWALLGTDTRPGPIVIASSLAAALLLVSGLFYFRRMEKTFADVV